MESETKVRGDLTDIGKQSFERSSKSCSERVEVRELNSEMNKDYADNLIKAAMKGKNKYEGSYFVVVLTKVEKLIQRCLRNMFFSYQYCPSPAYGQTVYKFNPRYEYFELLWRIPPKNICNKMYSDRLDLRSRSNPLMPFVVDFMEGKLHEKVMYLNGELEG